MIDDDDIGDIPNPDTSKTYYVIPHRSTLDYCAVTIQSNGTDAHGRVRIAGYRNRGWNPDGAHIKTRVPLDKLTEVNSDLEGFKALYDDPCHPSTRSR